MFENYNSETQSWEAITFPTETEKTLFQTLYEQGSITWLSIYDASKVVNNPRCCSRYGHYTRKLHKRGLIDFEWVIGADPESGRSRRYKSWRLAVKVRRAGI